MRNKSEIMNVVYKFVITSISSGHILRVSILQKLKFIYQNNVQCDIIDCNQYNNFINDITSIY